METENVRKQLKTSQNILKISSCINNENLNIQSNVHVFNMNIKFCKNMNFKRS